MTYQEFKEQILSRLHDFYGADAEINVGKVQKANGVEYEGICVTEKENRVQTAPILSLEYLYNYFQKMDATIEDCVGRIVDSGKKKACTDAQIFTQFLDWEFVKDTVYPVLCSTKDNEEMLKDLVHIPVMDLSAYYEVRIITESGGYATCKVTYAILECYGISEETLQKGGTAGRSCLLL